MPARSPGSLRVLSLNVAHGRGTAFHQALTRADRIRRNLAAVAQVVSATGADVVALQELDAPSSWSGDFDHLEHLARATGYAHAYHGLHLELGRLPRGLGPRLAYGTGVLSRYPIREGVSRRFDQNVLDTKGFVFCRIDAPQGPVDAVSVHLDFKRDRERRAQLALLSAFLDTRARTAPLVVAGDFNCALDDGDGILRDFVARHALSTGRDVAPTFPSGRPRRRIDEVFVSGGLRLRHAQVIDVEVSDHRPVLVELEGRR